MNLSYLNPPCPRTTPLVSVVSTALTDQLVTTAKLFSVFRGVYDAIDHRPVKSSGVSTPCGARSTRGVTVFFPFVGVVIVKSGLKCGDVNLSSPGEIDSKKLSQSAISQ